LGPVLDPPLSDYSRLPVTVTPYMYQPAHPTVSLDWHATVEKAEVLETFAGYHPSLLAVVK
jgi:hypothetical protein